MREFSNTGHGHVTPRPDGVKARCGGPGLCNQCSRELAASDWDKPLPTVVSPGLAPIDRTPSTFWQTLPHKRLIIAFTGLAGAGKSTAAAYLVKHHRFERVRFAGPLKAMMAALGLSQEQIEGSEKEKPCALLGGKTPRYAMQTIGTEWGRDLIDFDLWIRAWQAAVDAKRPEIPVVVDDCRFPNEAAAVRAAGGVLVRIDRPGAGLGAAGHVSEAHTLPSGWTILNDGSPDNLHSQVDAFLRSRSNDRGARA